MVVSTQKRVTVPVLGSEVRRDFYRNAIAFGRFLPIGGGDHDQVHVSYLLPLAVCRSAVTALLAPRSKFHQPPGESHNSPFADRGALTGCIDVEKNTPVRRQLVTSPVFRLWYFRVELLLQLLKTGESHK